MPAIADRATNAFYSSWVDCFGIFGGQFFVEYKSHPHHAGRVCCLYPNVPDPVAFWELMLVWASKGKFVHLFLYKLWPYQIIQCPCAQIIQNGGGGLGNQRLGWWKLDEGQGLLAVDSSPNHNDGTLIGSPVWVAGIAPVHPNPHALRFNDAGSGDVVQVPNLDLNTFSCSAWVQRSSLVDSGEGQGLVIARDDNGWGLGIGDAADINKLFLSKIGVSIVFSTGTIADTGVHHVVVTFDGSSVAFWIDGQLDSTVSYPVTFNSSGGFYGLGARHGTTVPNWYRGTLDDVRVYTNVLTAFDIQQIYRGEQ